MASVSREYWIDVLRAFACLMVLFCHAPQPFTGQPGQWLMAIDNYYGMAWGPALFFMISGACIIRPDIHAKSFLKKRLSRVLFPTLFWSIVYVLLECFVWHSITWDSVSYHILMIPFLPQYGSLWFIYALVAIYLVTPIVSSWICHCGKDEIELYLILWGITLLLPFLCLINNDFHFVSDITGPLYYLSGFLWVAVLGYYCRYHLPQTRMTPLIIIICLFVLSAPAGIWVIKRLTGYTISSSLSIDSVANTALAFVAFKSFPFKKRMKSVIEAISKYSFGIYLSHMLFLHPFNSWISQFGMNYIIQIPITVSVVGTCSFLLTWTFARFPWGKYLVG